MGSGVSAGLVARLRCPLPLFCLSALRDSAVESEGEEEEEGANDAEGARECSGRL